MSFHLNGRGHMSISSKLNRILPLSAASLALLQSSSSATAKTPDSAPQHEKPDRSNSFDFPKTNNLILTPADQEAMLKMYAGHSSHASHASHYSGTTSGHASHASHYSSAGTYPAQASPAPAYPAQTPTYSPQPQPRPRAVAVTPVAVSTNTVAQTNSLNNTTPTQNSDEADRTTIELLKKQASQGSADAQFTLGLYYYYGAHGLPQSREKSEMLLEMSALQGNFSAQNRLKMLREEGTKLEKENPQPQKQPSPHEGPNVSTPPTS